VKNLNQSTIDQRAASTDLDLAARDLQRAIKRYAFGSETVAGRTDRIERAWAYYKRISTARKLAAQRGE
jgi:hypothetical protein